jgi:hypothetical protein
MPGGKFYTSLVVTRGLFKHHDPDRAQVGAECQFGPAQFFAHFHLRTGKILTTRGDFEVSHMDNAVIAHVAIDPPGPKMGYVLD